MGIVVTVFMLLGLLTLSPWDRLSLGAKRNNPRVANFIGIGLLVTGLWNSLWHGLRYLNYFWGIAGLVSGVFMVAVAVMIIGQYSTLGLAKHAVMTKLYSLLQPLKLVCLLGLLASFLLYAMTLIQLNLGVAIIQ